MWVYSGLQHCRISAITKIQSQEIYVSEVNILLKWLTKRSVNTVRYVDLHKKIGLSIYCGHIFQVVT